MSLLRTVSINPQDTVYLLTANTWTQITIPEGTKVIMFRNQGVNNDGDTPCRIFIKFSDTQPSDTSSAFILDLKEAREEIVNGATVWAYSTTDNASLYVYTAR